MSGFLGANVLSTTPLVQTGILFMLTMFALAGLFGPSHYIYSGMGRGSITRTNHTNGKLILLGGSEINCTIFEYINTGSIIKQNSNKIET